MCCQNCLAHLQTDLQNNVFYQKLLTVPPQSGGDCIHLYFELIRFLLLVQYQVYYSSLHIVQRIQLFHHTIKPHSKGKSKGLLHQIVLVVRFPLEFFVY